MQLSKLLQTAILAALLTVLFQVGGTATAQAQSGKGKNKGKEKKAKPPKQSGSSYLTAKT